jgi:hypothetical protein
MDGKPVQLSDIQSKAIIIIKKVIAMDESVLLLSPVSGIYHLEYKNILIRFNECDCHIMNSQYSYYVYLPPKESDELINLFVKKMEKKTNKRVSVYEQKTTQSLQNIINSFNC